VVVGGVVVLGGTITTTAICTHTTVNFGVFGKLSRTFLEQM